jgi:hypothetical protein
MFRLLQWVLQSGSIAVLIVMGMAATGAVTTIVIDSIGFLVSVGTAASLTPCRYARAYIGSIRNVRGGDKVVTSLRALQCTCALVIFGFSMTAIADEPSGADSGHGVWQKHEYSFQYFGFTTTYSCDGLASKLKVLLIAAGARADAKSTSDACDRGYGVPDKFARARLKFYTLAPVVNGENAGPPVNGVWRSVKFADRSPREVALGDCELIEQFRDKVLPMFTTRNVDSRMTCVPNQLSGSAINLQFEVLAGVPSANKK